MASKQEIETGKCPQCHHESRWPIWTEIDAVENPEMRDTIINGKLFLWECPNCAKEISIINDLLYFDKNNHFAILLERDNAEDMVSAKGRLENPDDYERLRLCSGFLGMCEKIICLEQGLDDKALEIYKLLLLVNIDQPPDYFVCEGIDESGLLMRAWKDKKAGSLFAAPPELYRQIEQDLKGGNKDFEKKSFVRIDQSWAMRYLDEEMKEEN